MDELSALDDLLYGPGQPMAGSEMSDEEAMNHVRHNFPYGYYCIVRQWIWIDFDVSDEQHAELEKTQRQPVILCAHSVVFDIQRRWYVGDFVRTTPLCAFEEGFLFKTRNTIYLLLGEGIRKRATAETVARII